MNGSPIDRSRVTVVVPSYESNDTLPHALRSLAAQTVAHEVIIIDDGSAVPVEDAVDTGSAQIIRQENQGVGAARNVGIEQASGDVVAFLDADDVWDPAYLERQLHYLERLPGLAGVICAPHPPQAEAFTGTQLVPFESTLMTLRGGPGTSAWCFRRDALRQSGGFDPAFRRMQDYELLIRMTGQGFGVLRHDEPLYRYQPSAERGNRYSLAHQRALERFGHLYGNEERYPWVADRLPETERQRVRSLMFSRAMNVAALRGDVEEVRQLGTDASTDRTALPRKRRLAVAVAVARPRLYCELIRARSLRN